MTDFREIVVDACPRSNLTGTLEFCRELAKAFDARISVASYAWPKTSMKDVLAPNVFWAEEQTRLMERALASSRSMVDKVFGADSEQVHWCSGIGEPTAAMQAHLLTADLLITDSSDEDESVLPNPAHVALGSGVPVLRLGRSVANARFPRILVAWKDTAQARRAVHDALPLLVRAESVSVVGVGDEVSSERLDAVATHLRSHGAKAQYLHLPNTAGDACSSLLEQAGRERSDLIVTGVFGRNSLAERVFGGVTTEMLRSTEICWFMSH
ncbi:universal stress protein (plasmid) [Nitratireductor rhodophyticola]|uniref:Universal stress protein n=1 Tax=Nitratireductor rhodophyticola TaxID=2854036 RepID=A0ABS7RDL9_9HYPH|nr:universal stress protein [Nitratireductor rhodophyticola]MAS13077.1 universal stress protein UspA [Nitratireductor sp.]MBY8919021.1 universal stress protein [Nitratireductor rhodophyticola]MBY8923128.1 universal stress protein [Nitratireductor rhodophyticola]WPZ16258.1 universal stress protein [Nitratireductor rhodophyticola]